MMEGHNPLSHAERAIVDRHTTRAFLPDPVSQPTVDHLLWVASQSPSGSNIQPWFADVVRGEALTALAKDLRREHDAWGSPGGLV